ncbi:MAG TPA: hypothetical protein VEK08_19900 [Planctomycetota bacterium]|nr:hypothetical protein [Planctomycetota bacterium]
MQQMLAKKISLAVLMISGLMLAGASMSGANALMGASATAFAGALISLAIAENNPRE